MDWLKQPPVPHAQACPGCQKAIAATTKTPMASTTRLIGSTGQAHVVGSSVPGSTMRRGHGLT